MIMVAAIAKNHCLALDRIPALSRRDQTFALSSPAMLMEALFTRGKRHSHVPMQLGQIFPLSLLILGIVSSLALFLGKYALDINRAHHRQNLADAAALSAATWRARALNFNAFANRALIAQEVYAAYLTEANGWAAYAKSLAKRGQELAQIFPAAQPAAQTIARLVTLDEQLLYQLSELELFARTAPGLGLNDQLASAQYAFLRSADGFGLSAIANEIVQAADSNAFAHVVAGDRFSQSWSSEVTDQSKAQQQKLIWQSLRTQAQTIEPSSSEAKGHDVDAHQLAIDHQVEDQIAPIPTLNCIPRSLKQLAGRLVRESALQQLESGWQSNHSLSLHGWRRGRLLPICGDQQESMPIAWAQRQSSHQTGADMRSTSTESAELQDSIHWQNRQAKELAQRDSSNFDSYFGAGRLTRIDPQNVRVLRHPLRILISVRTGPKQSAGYSFGAAWVFHPDPIHESASPSSFWLFPNWQARLSVPTKDEILQAEQGATGR